MVLTQANTIDQELLKAPISSQLLVPCRVAYPFRVLSPQGSLRDFYGNVEYNLGQASKCYSKDEELIKEVGKK